MSDKQPRNAAVYRNLRAEMVEEIPEAVPNVRPRNNGRLCRTQRNLTRFFHDRGVTDGQSRSTNMEKKNDEEE